MKKKFSKLIFAFLLTLVATAFSHQAFAQCRYVSPDALGNLTGAAMPCDFPVYLETGNPQADQGAYSAALTIWLAANPSFSVMSLTPGGVTDAYIEIPAAEFSGYPADRQGYLQTHASYYHVIP